MTKKAKVLAVANGKYIGLSMEDRIGALEVRLSGLITGNSTTDIAPAHKPVTPPPETIKTVFQALDKIANGGRFIVFGDMHDDSMGHHVLVDMMPTLKNSRVSVLGIEWPPQWNDYFADLQNSIRNGWTPERTYLSFKNQAKGLGVIIGGDSMIRDTAAIVYAATKSGIRVVGIDARHEPENVAPMAQVSAQYKEYLDSAWKSLDLKKYGRIQAHTLMWLDDLSASEADLQLAQEKPIDRMAIMYGQAHSCEDDRARLSTALGQYGSVTKISLIQDPDGDRLMGLFCDEPAVTTKVDGANFKRSAYRNPHPVAAP